MHVKPGSMHTASKLPTIAYSCFQTLQLWWINFLVMELTFVPRYVILSKFGSQKYQRKLAIAKSSRAPTVPTWFCSKSSWFYEWHLTHLIHVRKPSFALVVGILHLIRSNHFNIFDLWVDLAPICACLWVQPSSSAFPGFPYQSGHRPFLMGPII